MVRRALVVAVGLLQLLQVGCSNDGTSKTATRNGSGHQLISDGAHQGSAHFFFLPPLVPAPAYSGVFDPTLSPTVTVCELAGSACSSTIAQFSMTAGIGSEVVRLDSTGGQYIVNWHTDQCASGPCTLSMTSTYRIRIRVGLAELGFADVAVVASAKDLAEREQRAVAAVAAADRAAAEPLGRADDRVGRRAALVVQRGAGRADSRPFPVRTHSPGGRGGAGRQEGIEEVNRGPAPRGLRRQPDTPSANEAHRPHARSVGLAALTHPTSHRPRPAFSIPSSICNPMGRSSPFRPR